MPFCGVALIFKALICSAKLTPKKVVNNLHFQSVSAHLGYTLSLLSIHYLFQFLLNL